MSRHSDAHSSTSASILLQDSAEASSLEELMEEELERVPVLFNKVSERSGQFD